MDAQILGRLSVTVVRGSNLFPKAAGGTSNSYCVVSLPPSREQTEVCNASLNPEWNQFFTFNIYGPFETIEFVVQDDETGDFMGKATLPLESLSDQQSHTQILELHPREIQDEVSGNIEVQLQYKYTALWENMYAGITAVKQEKYEQAIPLLTTALEKLPDETRLYESRSIAYIHTKQLKDALADAVRMRDINPNVAAGHYRIGQVYQAAGKLEEAKKAYTAGLIYSNKDPQILKAIESLVNPQLSTLKAESADDGQAPLVETLYNAGNYKEALDEVNFLLKKNPRNGSLYLARIAILIGVAKDKGGSTLNRGELVKMIGADSIMVGQLMPTWAKENALKSGYMKKGGEFNRFKKRSKGDTEPNGAIPISLGVTRKIGKEKFVIRVPGRDYELSDKVATVDGWISEIKKASAEQMKFPKIKISELGTRHKRVSSGSHKSLRVLTQMIADTNKKVQLINRKNVIREGILYKTGKVRKAWKQRYFILKPMELYYFEEEPTEPNPMALGVIDLHDMIWKKGEGDSFAQHMFEIETPNRTYHLYAITRDDMYEWKAAIELCSQEDFRPSSLSLREESFMSQAAPKAEIPPEPVKPESPQQTADSLPDLSNVSVLNEANEDEFEIVEVNETQEEEMPMSPISPLSSTGMSSSESRYFKKFGLKPPEQVNKRASVLLTKGTNLTPAPTRAMNIQETPGETSHVPYTSISISKPQGNTPQGNPQQQKPPTEKTPLVSNQRTPTPQGNTPQGNPQQRRRPPPPTDDGCSCALL